MLTFLTHKSFLLNLLVAIVLVLLLLFLFFNSLDFITEHNKTQKVPLVLGHNLEEAKKILEENGLEVAVQDSVYIDTTAPHAVVRQSPDADAIVKMHRTIYLTINRAVPPLIEMPDLRGFSLKSAELYLQSLGLKVGKVSSTPDIAKNAVKEQLLNGKKLEPGTKVNMSSTIDFVIGSGLGSDVINVPVITGMTLAEARAFLNSKGINIGSILLEDAAAISEQAYIVKQSPLPFSTIAPGEVVANKIRPGQLMDVWLSDFPPVVDTTQF